MVDEVAHEMSRRVAWDCYASSALGMSLHPGTTRDSAKPKTTAEIAGIADALLAERDKRFSSMGDG